MMTSLALLAVLGLAQPPQAPLEWAKVGKNKHESISGLVRWSDTSGGKTRFIMVLDNKKPDEVMISWIASSDNGWKKDEIKISDPQKLASDAEGKTQIKDLEGICRIPEIENEVLAIGDKGDAQGWLYRFKIDGDKAVLLDAFTVPNVLPDSDYEAIDLYKSGNNLIAVWADRGTPDRPAAMAAATIDFGKRPGSPFGPLSKFSVKTPWPTLFEARSVADLRVSGAGDIYVSSVSDPGDEGPFDSAIYIVAKVTAQAEIKPYGAPMSLCLVPGHKIEALDINALGRELVFGTDDENFGGWIAWYQK